jgi:purine nucleoside permease
MMNRRVFSPLLVALALVAFATPTARAADLIRPKVIVMATFEIGADTGDKPGEFQFWVEREKLTQTLTVPGLDRPVRS